MSAFMPSRRDGFFLIGAVLLVTLYVMLAQAKFDYGFPLDDAWIHQTYARNLAEHGEWAYFPGEPSAASTAPLYTVLLSMGHLLNLSPFLWANFLGILCLAWAASIGARIGEQLFLQENSPPIFQYVGWLTGFTILLAWHLVWAAASGMETMLFMALSLTLIYLAFQAEQAPFMIGIVGGLLTLTRPEGVGLVGLVGLFMLMTRPSLRWVGMVIISWLIVISPYVLWNYDLTGELLPSTADAKIMQHAPLREAPIYERYFNMLLPVIIGGQFIGIPGILLGVRLVYRRVQENRRNLIFLMPLVWALAHLTIFVLRLPANYQHGRYVMPILPPLLLYMSGGLLDLVWTYRKTAGGRVATRTLALGTFIAFPAFAWIGGQAYANDVQLISSEMVETAKWVEANIPSDELLVVHDIGAVGYYAPRNILDFAGLVSSEIVPFINDPEQLMRYVCEQHGQWLMALPDQRQRLVEDSDPRLELVHESPYDYMAQARGDTQEAWKMRVYRIYCDA